MYLLLAETITKLPSTGMAGKGSYNLISYLVVYLFHLYWYKVSFEDKNK